MSKRILELKTNIVLDPLSGQHRLKAWINLYQDMEPEIFVYQRYPALPGEAEPDDHFVNVASAADLADYPRTHPVGTVPFFRLSYIDVLFRSVDLLNRSVTLIREDIAALVLNLDRLDGLGVTSQYTFEGMTFSSSGGEMSSSSSLNSSSNS